MRPCAGSNVPRQFTLPGAKLPIAAPVQPEQRRRLEVRPGVSGWAQVKGRNRLSWDARFALDVYYVENRSLWFDVKIILMTLSLMLKRGGGVEPEGAPIMEEFRGSDEK